MDSLMNILFIVSLCLFITHVFNEPVPTSIRERQNTSNIAFVNLTSNESLAVKPQNISNTSVNVSGIRHVSEGGSVSSTVFSHNTREHVIESPKTDAEVNKPAEDSNPALTKSEDIKPVHEESSLFNVEVPPQHDHDKPSVAKKGVILPASEIQEPRLPITNVNNSTDIDKKLPNTISGANVANKNASMNETIIPTKPKVTESDEYVDTSKSKENVLSIDQIDPLIADNKSNRSDYIVPIVAVILSVPLVAILISVVYKRGTDWWQHRNYKRMDFLIEGIYHN